MIPPRRRRTKWRVDSCKIRQHFHRISNNIENRHPSKCSAAWRVVVDSTHLLDVVVGEGTAILELLASKDQTLLVRGDTLLVLDLGLDIVDGVGGLDLKGDGLARQGLHETI